VEATASFSNANGRHVSEGHFPDLDSQVYDMAGLGRDRGGQLLGPVVPGQRSTGGNSAGTSILWSAGLRWWLSGFRLVLLPPTNGTVAVTLSGGMAHAIDSSAVSRRATCSTIRAWS